jgi:FixJ family two-component response regulator
MSGVTAPENHAVVHVVEDDESVRNALARLFRGAGFETRTYRSAAEFLVAERADTPGCIVLDVGLPGMSGMELQAATARHENALPIVFLTGRGDIETSVRAMKAGAVDFLTKPVKRDAMLGAVRAALASDTERRGRRQEARVLRARFDTLTSREREVLAGVVRGKLNKQIAEELGTSVRTIKAHRSQVMEKMGMRSVAELVRAADRLTALETAREGAVDRAA